MDAQQAGNLGHGFAVRLNELTGMSDLLGRGPKRTPRALAAILPVLVRSTIRDRSKSAMPANTVSTMRPAGVVVSAHGSASERKPAPASLGSFAGGGEILR